MSRVDGAGHIQDQYRTAGGEGGSAGAGRSGDARRAGWRAEARAAEAARTRAAAGGGLLYASGVARGVAVAREPHTAEWPAQSRDRKGADPSRHERLGSAPLRSRLCAGLSRSLTDL